LIDTFSALGVIALVIRLGLDALGVRFALGMIGVPARHRLRMALPSARFEAAMLCLALRSVCR
jgi:hypothetical protein